MIKAVRSELFFGDAVDNTPVELMVEAPLGDVAKFFAQMILEWVVNKLFRFWCQLNIQLFLGFWTMLREIVVGR